MTPFFMALEYTTNESAYQFVMGSISDKLVVMVVTLEYGDNRITTQTGYESARYHNQIL